MDKTLGVYLHIPFCAGRCAYCDFYTCAGRDNLIPAYQKALLRHIGESRTQLREYLTDTVYFGGGTPTYYGADRLIMLFDAIKDTARVLRDAEVTAEVNPGTVTFEQLRRMRRNGFNRLSIGVQSANDGILRSQGRKHTFAQAVETLRQARLAGFENVSCDLIYGLPSQTRDDWADTIMKVAALKPDHVSCYGLKIAPGTPLWPYRQAPELPDGDAQADMYLYAVEALGRYGYRQYEISNFALRDRESRHNLKYWTGGEYLGLGAAAHSYLGGRRYSNVVDVKKYITAMEQGLPVVDYEEQVGPYERGTEYLMLGLRTVRGISEKEYREIYPCSFELIRIQLEEFRAHGWVVESGGRWRFTPQGFLISNVLIGDVLDAQNRQREKDGTPWQQGAGAREMQYSMFRRRTETVPAFRGM